MTVQRIPTPAALRHCDPMVLVKLMQEGCGCGCEPRHGWLLKNGKATCPRCGFVVSVKAKKEKAAKRRPPAPRPAVIYSRAISTLRPRERGATCRVGAGRDGPSSQRDDGSGDGGGGSSDGDGGGSGEPPGPSPHDPAGASL